MSTYINKAQKENLLGMYCHMIWSKNHKNQSVEQGWSFIKWCWSHWMSTCRRRISHCYKNELRMDHNWDLKLQKSKRRYMIKIFVSFRLSKGFFDITQKAWSIADKIEKLDFINIKNLWVFHGSSVVRNPQFHCRGPGFDLLLELRSCKASQSGAAKNKKPQTGKRYL